LQRGWSQNAAGIHFIGYAQQIRRDTPQLAEGRVHLCELTNMNNLEKILGKALQTNDVVVIRSFLLLKRIIDRDIKGIAI
jgi:hypothetical protein